MKEYLKRIIYDLVKKYDNSIFINDNKTREKLKTNILYLFKQKYPDEKIEVICDETNNTPNIIMDNNICVKVKI